jgi:hypothetical protein
MPTLINQDDTIRAGNAHILRVTVKDSDDAAVDITGATIKWSLALRRGSETVLVEKESGDGIEIVDAEDGIFEIAIDAADTEDLGGIYYHEAELTDSLDRKQTVMVGFLTIEKVLIA